MNRQNDLPSVSSTDINTPSDVPWPDRQLWQAANRILHDLIRRYSDDLDECRFLADTIRRHLKKIDSIMETVCAVTCPWCPDPCCMKATVWFDLPDLLFIHLIKIDIPPGQPKVKRKDICRYLGPRGCRLPRHSRPWACTRYICPTQKRWWQAMESASTRTHPAICEELIQKIRNTRQKMETAFIAVVAGTHGAV